MTKFIVHRINKISELNKIKNFYGMEIDVRDKGNKIILSHDPNSNGEELSKFIKKIKKQILFINIKSHGLIEKIIPIIKKTNFFFLDLSFSEINFLIENNMTKKIIIRFSVYESFNLKKKYFQNIKWVWYDLFRNHYISKKEYSYIKKYNKKICIVSPELLGKPKKDVKKFIMHLNKNKIIVDAVCTKKNFIDFWKENYLF